jgi:hypothetical protein
MNRIKLTFSNGNTTNYPGTATVKTQTAPEGIAITAVQVNDVLICWDGQSIYTQTVTKTEIE